MLPSGSPVAPTQKAGYHVCAMRTLLGLLLAILLPSAAMAEQVEGKPPASLLIFPKGENVRYDPHHEGGVWQAYYNVQVEYPAEEVLQFICNGLEHHGWQPLTEDILNPGEASSHVTGWGNFLDGTTSPETVVDQWLAQWKNAQGDVVWYVLRYRHPKGTWPRPKTVSVFASYFPAKIVKLQLKSVEEDRAKKQKQE